MTRKQFQTEAQREGWTRRTEGVGLPGEMQFEPLDLCADSSRGIDECYRIGIRVFNQTDVSITCAGHLTNGVGTSDWRPLGPAGIDFVKWEYSDDCFWRLMSSLRSG